MILPGYNPTTKAHGRVLSDAAKLFEQSYRPVLYVGGGAVRSDAGELVEELAEVTGAPIVTTLPARGIVPDSDPKVSDAHPVQYNSQHYLKKNQLPSGWYAWHCLYAIHFLVSGYCVPIHHRNSHRHHVEN